MKTYKCGNLSDLITKCKAFLTIPLNSYTRMLLREVEVHLITFYDGIHFSPVSGRTAISLEMQNGQESEKGPNWGSIQGNTYNSVKPEMPQ